MTRPRLSLLLPAALVLLVAAAPSPAVATMPGGVGAGVLTGGELSYDTTTRGAARLTPDEVTGIVESDREVIRALQRTPGLLPITRFDNVKRTWRVTYALPDSDNPRLTVIVRDSDGAIIERDIPAKAPPKMQKEEAIRIARRSDELAEVVAPLRVEDLKADARYDDGKEWDVNFREERGGEVLAQVEVEESTRRVTGVYTDHQIAWEMARGREGAFGGEINKEPIWWALCALFVLLMIQPVRWRSWTTVDLLVLCSFAVSHSFFRQGMIEWSIPLAMPPLVYLFARLSWLYWRGVPAAPPPTRVAVPLDRPGAGRRERWSNKLELWMLRLWHEGSPTWVLWGIAVFALGARYGYNVWGSNVIDVGYAGVIGGDHIAEGKLPYGNMPDNNRHGDTYGPLNYLLYVPAVWVFGFSGDWDELPAAHATTIAFDVLTVAVLAFVGWRWISRRAAAWLAAGWALYPYSTFAVVNNVNDTIVSALLVCAFAALAVPVLRGVFVGAAAAVKFVPLIVLPIIAHAGTSRRVRQVLLTGLGVALVAAASVGFLAAYPKGLHEFAEATWGFQYDRESPFSPWGLYELRWPQLAAQGLLLAYLTAALVWPRSRDFRQIAAGMGMAVVGLQIVLQHWFYLYIPWFAWAFLLVIVAQRECRADQIGTAARTREVAPPAASVADSVPGPSVPQQVVT